MQRFFTIDMDGSRRFDTLAQAKDAAEGELDTARDESADGGWPEETTRICYGVIVGQVVETSHKSIEDLDAEGDESAAASMRANGWDYMATHELIEDPALRDVLADMGVLRAEGYVPNIERLDRAAIVRYAAVNLLLIQALDRVSP